MKEFYQRFSQGRWDDDPFVVAYHSVDHVELIPAIVVIRIDVLKVFGGSPDQGVSTRCSRGSFIVMMAIVCSPIKLLIVSAS